MSNNSKAQLNIDVWTDDQYNAIIAKLIDNDCVLIKTRDEYTLLKEEKTLILTEDSKHRHTPDPSNPVIPTDSASGVNSSFGVPRMSNDTTSYDKKFLAHLDFQKGESIADVLSSFKVIQSDKLSLNIGLDTEFQEFKDGSCYHRCLLSIQMSIITGDTLLRYFFLIHPNFQRITADGGLIRLKYCLADILNDVRNCYCPDFPLVRKESLITKEINGQNNESYKAVDFSKMKNSITPITLICHAGRADISVFRRSKKQDIDLLRKVSEIQGGWMTPKAVHIKAESDHNFNYFWLIDLNVRDTMGLTPADNKSLKALGDVINRPKIDLSISEIENMADFAVSNPIEYYEYAMNDSDIVVLFCSMLFRVNHIIPMTLSSAAARSMYNSFFEYFGVSKKSDFDKIYRGLELIDEGLVSQEDTVKFARATRYVPLRSNPDAKLISEFFEEAYTGGFNASFYLGWITEETTDFDLQNAYPTAMACILDLDWSEYARDLPRDYLRLQDLISPVIPAVAVGDFDFPESCYCPNIPVPGSDGLKIYPRHGKNVYMTGADMYLALQLGAKIKVFRGFTCQILEKNGAPSQSLAYSVTNLVQDRLKAKELYKDKPLIEKSLKAMVNSCYGKIAQNVSPKTRYNAKIMGREDSGISAITSPYHAAYTTALVRCMLIGCINQLHDMGYYVYSATTDGLITDAPTEVVRALDAYGFAQIFQKGRYTLNQTQEDCAANQIWEPKHYNDAFLNITTRGNVAINDEGVLAHNSYITGEDKDSRADRDALIIAVLSREGKLKCPTKVWTKFSEMVERKHDFQVSETIRNLSMNFDYKRCPLLETAKDTPVHYESVDGLYSVDTVIAEFDTRPFEDIDEFVRYRKTMKTENCVKITDDLKRVKAKSNIETKGYIKKDLSRKILLSILMGYRSGIYKIPALDGLSQSESIKEINSWDISEISINDWKNCGRTDRQKNMLDYKDVKETLSIILQNSSK